MNALTFMNPLTFLLTHKRLPYWAVAIIMMLACGLVQAQTTGGLAKTTSALTKFRDNMYIIVPIIAVIAGIILGVMYASDLIRKDTLWNWLIGVVIVGSIAEVVALII